MTCSRCNQDKYAAHKSQAPHGSVPQASECEGYVPTYACGQCGTDVERHEPGAPHACILRGITTCTGAVLPSNWPQENPPEFEGGGGSGGGGGASGGWFW